MQMDELMDLEDISDTSDNEDDLVEFSQDEIPFNHLKINVTYDEDDNRKYSFEAFGHDNIEVIEGLKQ